MSCSHPRPLWRTNRSPSGVVVWWWKILHFFLRPSLSIFFENVWSNGELCLELSLVTSQTRPTTHLGLIPPPPFYLLFCCFSGYRHLLTAALHRSVPLRSSSCAQRFGFPFFCYFSSAQVQCLPATLHTPTSVDCWPSIRPDTVVSCSTFRPVKKWNPPVQSTRSQDRRAASVSKWPANILDFFSFFG